MRGLTGRSFSVYRSPDLSNWGIVGRYSSSTGNLQFYAWVSLETATSAHPTGCSILTRGRSHYGEWIRIVATQRSTEEGGFAELVDRAAGDRALANVCREPGPVFGPVRKRGTGGVRVVETTGLGVAASGFGVKRNGVAVFVVVG